MSVLSMLSARGKYRFLPVLTFLLLVSILSWLSSAFLIQDFMTRVLSVDKYGSIRISLALSVFIVALVCLIGQVLVERAVLFFTLHCLLPATILTFIGGARLLCTLTLFLGFLGLFVLGRRRCLRAIHVLAALNGRARSTILALRLSHSMWWQPYAARYGAIHVGVLMSAVFSLAMTGPALVDYYFFSEFQASSYMLLVCLVLALLMCLSFYLLIRGYFRGAWVLFFILVVCLFSCLPLIFESRHRALALFNLVFPSLGLYWMSTRRYQRGLKVLAVARRVRLRLKALEVAILKN